MILSQSAPVMKKLLIIVSTLVAATWLLVLPGVVGKIVGDRVPQWLSESAASSESRFESGWFGSRLTLTDTYLSAELEARHVPPTRPGWLQVSGTVDLPQLPDGSRVDGFIHIDGRTRVALEAPRFDFAGPTRTTLRAVDIEFEQSPAGMTRIDLDAARLGLVNANGLKLDYAGLSGQLQRRPVDETASRLALNLRLGEPSDPQFLELVMTAAPVDNAAFDELLAGLGQLSSARPDSYDAQLALLTLAGAWQGLASAGLVIELDRLSVGEASRLAGRWEIAAGQPLVTGAGKAEALLEWLNRIVALTRGQTTAAAEPEARAWIRILVERSWLRIDGERFRFAYPSGVGDGSAGPDRPESDSSASSR
jgi:hypothetical protein